MSESQPARSAPAAGLRSGLPAGLAPILCVLGFGLLAMPQLWVAALGMECLSAAFWIAGRAAVDADTQLKRWEWLRRPATALWIAVAMRALRDATVRDGIAPESAGLATVA